MVLYTKCIFEPRDAADGRRISVMSRHTLEDGVTHDARTDGQYDEWMKILAPPDTLVGAHYRSGDRDLFWHEFTGRYMQHLHRRAVSDAVRRLAHRAVADDITILCVEPKGENCHRLLLADECRRYVLCLDVAHR